MSELTLSPDQSAAIDAVRAWYHGVLERTGAPEHCESEACFPYPHTHGCSHGEPVFAVGGLAGSGKTTIARLLEDELGVRIAYGTPTHRAAGVLRRKLSEDQGRRVRTYHSMTYYASPRNYCASTQMAVRSVPYTCTCEADDRKSCVCSVTYQPCEHHAGQLAQGIEVKDCDVREELVFQRREFLGGKRDLIVVDEASMLTQSQVQDVRGFGVPVLLIGDHGQLPPVKAEMNPWMLQPDAVLQTNHRQADRTGIVQAALTVRAHGMLPLGSYGDGSTAVIDLSHPAALTLLDPTRFPPSPERIVIAWTNRQRATVNRAFHGAGPLRVGDRLISMQNHEDAPVMRVAGDGGTQIGGQALFVANGMAGPVLAVLGLNERAGIADVVIHLDDGDMPGDEGVMVRIALAQLGAEAQLPLVQRPRGAQLWDYAYCITAHKAQGGEYREVIVLDQAPMDYSRWMYTAVTRAKERLVVLRMRA
jgi:exodeoxyribonuclease V